MATPFHSRADWGAKPPKTTPATIGSGGLTVHYGGDSPWGTSVDRSTADRFLATADHSRCASIVRAWQSFHMASVSAGGRGWNDIAYNAGICPHGHRYDMRGPGRRSGANGTNPGNDRSEAIVYIAGGDDPLTDPAKHAYHDEGARFHQPLRWNHSDWKSTSCAGGPIKTWQSQGWPRPQGDELSMADLKTIDDIKDDTYWMRENLIGGPNNDNTRQLAELLDGQIPQHVAAIELRLEALEANVARVLEAVTAPKSG